MENKTDFEKIAELYIRISHDWEFRNLIEGHKREHSGEDDPVNLGTEINVYDEKPGLIKVEASTNQGEKEIVEYDLDAEIEKKFTDAIIDSLREFLNTYSKTTLQPILKDLHEDISQAVIRVKDNPFFNDFPKYRRTLKKIHGIIDSAYSNTKLGLSTSQKASESRIKKKTLSGIALQKKQEKEERMKAHWPKIVEAVNKTIGNRPIEDFITEDGNASSKLYTYVSKKYKAVKKGTLRNWLDEKLKSGRLQDDLKKLDQS